MTGPVIEIPPTAWSWTRGFAASAAIASGPVIITCEYSGRVTTFVVSAFKWTSESLLASSTSLYVPPRWVTPIVSGSVVPSLSMPSSSASSASAMKL